MTGKKDFGWMLARYCAPTLAGFKPANIFRYTHLAGWAGVQKVLAYYNRRLNGQGVFLELLRENGGAALILAYRKTHLEHLLRDPARQRFLAAAGYPSLPQPPQAISRLRERIGEDGGFPHEIGIFLGYPLCDVAGFMANGGKGCLFCGHWKVYANAPQKRRLFACYKACTRRYCALAAAGVPVENLARYTYKEELVS